MSSARCHCRLGKPGAFTLVELLVSMAIMSIIMIALLTALSQTQTLYNTTRDRAEKYREARVAFETVSRRLSNATLNTYWGYDNPERPTEYARQSELHFVTGPMAELVSDKRRNQGHGIFFTAPFGYGGTEAGRLGGGREFGDLPETLNCWGYYVEYNSDVEATRPLRPGFLAMEEASEQPERKRFRLMEYRLPTEKLGLFDKHLTDGTGLGDFTDRDEIYEWFADDELRAQNSAPIAENIVGIFFTPRAPGKLENSSLSGSSIAPDYLFDSRRYQWENKDDPLSKISRHQIPPVIDMTIVAVTEGSWQRFAEDEGSDARVKTLEDFVGEIFLSAGAFDEDLKSLEDQLSELNLDYRIFSTTIALRSGKWITSEQN